MTQLSAVWQTLAPNIISFTNEFLFTFSLSLKLQIFSNVPDFVLRWKL